jgi:hypothetical protein
MALNEVASAIVALLIVMRLCGYKLPAKPLHLPTQFRLWHLFAATTLAAVFLTVLRYRS